MRDDYGKLWFNIIDYTGSATRLFADPAFDGDPVQITEEELKEERTTPEVIHEDTPLRANPEDRARRTRPNRMPEERRKFYFDGGQVEIAAHLVYDLDPDGKQLRVVRYTEYAAEKVRTLCPTAPALRARWADAEQRSELIKSLEERGIDFAELADAAKQPEADPFDLLCHLAFNAPLRTRRERAQKLRESRNDLFSQYGAEARQILDELLEKYAEHGDAQFVLPDVLKVPPLSAHGQLADIIRIFRRRRTVARRRRRAPEVFVCRVRRPALRPRHRPLPNRSAA